jgi:hypothetical protein
MNTNWNTTIVVVAIATILSGSLWANRQEKTAEKPAAASATKSAPEMERLRFYLGDWDYTETYEKTSFAPNGGKNTGLYQSKLGPGGNSLLNSFHSQGPIGDFEGLLVLTWDANEKAYKQYVFGNDFPGCVVETGQFEGDTLVFRGEVLAGDTKIRLRNAARLVAPGKIHSEEYMTVGGSPEVLLVVVEERI